MAPTIPQLFQFFNIAGNVQTFEWRVIQLPFNVTFTASSGGTITHVKFVWRNFRGAYSILFTNVVVLSYI